MADAKKNEIPKSDLDTLVSLCNLLHLFNHRNKNQHRHSIWWRHFSTFRRQATALTSELSSLHTPATTHLARAKKKVADVATRERVDQRLLFWRTVVVAKWQHAFSQLVADGRFAVLGLVLLAILAHMCQIVGVTVELEALGQAEVEKVLEKFGKEDWGLDRSLHAQEEVVGEDQGEVVERHDGPDLSASVSVESAAHEAKSVKPRKRAQHDAETGTKKKKRKTGNAIDDLFSGLD